MKYWKRVKVKSWFYEWLEWIVVHEQTEWWKPTWKYLVKFNLTNSEYDETFVTKDEVETV